MLTEKYFHHPKIDHSADTNVLIIGIGYIKTLRDLWHSVKYPINRAYISRNLLVAATMLDIDRMRIYDYVRKEHISPINVIKKTFCVQLVQNITNLLVKYSHLTNWKIRFELHQ